MTTKKTSAKKGKGSANALTVSETPVEIAPADNAEPTTEFYVRAIHAVCCRGGIAVGKLLIDAKDKLPHGEFTEMVDCDLPFGPRTAERLMVVARNEVLSNPTYSSVLPGTWTVLHELALVDEELDAPGTLEAWVKQGFIHRGIKGREVEKLVEHERALKDEAGKREAEDRPKPHVDYVEYLKSLETDEEVLNALNRLCEDVNDFFSRELSVKWAEEEQAETGSKAIN
jgi:Protein of unknown function (DUF3102)